MKKMVCTVVGAVMLLAVTANLANAANADAGGVKGFLSGCTFGLRVGADYNDDGTGDRDFISWYLVGCCFGARAQADYTAGKSIHWREICRLIPYVNIVFAIWDGVDMAEGKGRTELQGMYGATYY